MNACPYCGAALQPNLRRCANCQRDLSAPDSGNDPADGTRLESVEEIEKAVKPRRTPTVKEQSSPDEAIAFRPIRRPPMVLICILDDGREDGEWVRVRTERIVIGRSQGDIVIPHDEMMSSRHAELFRQDDGGRHRWYLKDLGSTNGSYVRVGRSILKHGQVLLIGSRRYRFDAAPQGAGSRDESAEAEPIPKETKGWQPVEVSDLLPSLVELTAQGEGQRFLLPKPENWIGRDAKRCVVPLANDPLVSSKHARIFRDPRGKWFIENAGSRNGTWLRIEKLVLDSNGQFQLGEQRFLVRALR